VKQDDNTDKKINADEIEDAGKSTLSSDPKEDDFGHQLEDVLPGQARWDKSL
jgi:hypothetical protein